MIALVSRALELTALMLAVQVGDTSTVPADSLRAPSRDSVLTVSVGGFVDAYYAFDRGRPHRIDRAFTTQAARHSEFNVNLAYLEAMATGPRVRGRLAVQAGTSVQANYGTEPRIGEYSGPELGRLIQEAYVGMQVRPSLWIDGGIFFSNVGMEGWVSRDNPIYTRSLVADYSPYYSSGVRAQWTPSGRLMIRMDLVNGWQKISEDNGAKSVGARVEYAVTPTTTVVWYGLAGTEAEDQQRRFQGVGFRSAVKDRVELMGQIDFGRQRDGARPESSGGLRPHQVWRGAMLIARMRVSPTTALVGRIEHYADPDQAIATSPISASLRARGGSLGVDVMPAPRLLWRNEARLLTNADAIFPDRNSARGFGRRNLVLVSSIALTF